MVQHMAPIYSCANATNARAREPGTCRDLLESKQTRKVSALLLLCLALDNVVGGSSDAVSDRFREERVAAFAFELRLYSGAPHVMYRDILLLGEFRHGPRASSSGAGERDASLCVFKRRGDKGC